ncbi:hypothetical protein ACPCXA_23450 [Lysinibacillus agricola]
MRKRSVSQQGILCAKAKRQQQGILCAKAKHQQQGVWLLPSFFIYTSS